MLKLITYDLRKPGQDYAGLSEAIQALGAWCHPLESVWLVKTNLTTVQVQKRLRPQLDANDSLLVVGQPEDWAAVGLHGEYTNWMNAI
jgi:hypothetical protein